jgi:hypothetical protein
MVVLSIYQNLSEFISQLKDPGQDKSARIEYPGKQAG